MLKVKLTGLVVMPKSMKDNKIMVTSTSWSLYALFSPPFWHHNAYAEEQKKCGNSLYEKSVTKWYTHMLCVCIKNVVFSENQ